MVANCILRCKCSYIFDQFDVTVVKNRIRGGCGNADSIDLIDRRNSIKGILTVKDRQIFGRIVLVQRARVVLVQACTAFTTIHQNRRFCSQHNSLINRIDQAIIINCIAVSRIDRDLVLSRTADLANVGRIIG